MGWGAAGVAVPKTCEARQGTESKLGMVTGAAARVATRARVTDSRVVQAPPGGRVCCASCCAVHEGDD